MTEPALLALLGVAGYGLAVLTNLLLSHQLGPEVYGDYSVGFTVLTMMTTLSLLGTDMSAGRFIPGLRRDRDDIGLRGYFGWNRRRVGRAFVGVLLVYLLFLLVATTTHVLGYKRMSEYHLAFHSLWIVPILAVGVLFRRYLVASGHALAGGILAGLAPYLLILASIGIAVAGLHVPLRDAPVIIAVWAVSFSVLTALQFAMLRRSEPAMYEAFRHGGRGMASSERLWARACDGMMMVRVSGLALWHLDLLIVEAVAPDEASVGLYAAVLLLARILQLVPGYVMFMIQPRVGTASADASARPALQRAIHAANLILLIVSSLILAGMLLERQAILGWFGPDFPTAAPALVPLAIGAFVAAMTRQSRVILMTSGGERILSRISVAGLVLLVVAGVPVTRAYSIFGMAVVSSLVLVGQAMVVYLFARRQLPGVRPLSIA